MSYDQTFTGTATVQIPGSDAHPKIFESEVRVQISESRDGDRTITLGFVETGSVIIIEEKGYDL